MLSLEVVDTTETGVIVTGATVTETLEVEKGALEAAEDTEAAVDTQVDIEKIGKNTFV